MNDLSMHIMDIVYNSIKAKATLVEINLNYNTNSDILLIEIKDNGTGIEEERLNDITSPFTTSRTTRKVGLGLSLFKLTAKQADGNLKITSEFGKYTQVTVTMKKSHIDCIPIGNLGEAIYLLTINDTNCEIKYSSSVNQKSFTYDSIEIKELVGDEIKVNLDVIEWIKSYINENNREIGLN
ncbi:MAG: ATP-binding protein [Bacilli bacterium]